MTGPTCGRGVDGKHPGPGEGGDGTPAVAADRTGAIYFLQLQRSYAGHGNYRIGLSSGQAEDGKTWGPGRAGNATPAQTGDRGMSFVF